MKSKSGPARIVGLRDNDDCEDFCDSNSPVYQVLAAFGFLSHKTWSIASLDRILFSLAPFCFFSLAPFCIFLSAPFCFFSLRHSSALLPRLGFPFFPSAVSSPRGPYSQIGLHWGDKCWANALKTHTVKLQTARIGITEQVREPLLAESVSSSQDLAYPCLSVIPGVI